MAWHCKFHTDRTILAAVIGTAVIGTAVIGTAVVFYVIRKSTKEKEDLQKQNDHLKRENERLVNEKEDLQTQNDSLKSEKEGLGKEKEALQKQNETLKQEKEKVEAEKEDLQKQNDSLKSEKEGLVKGKEDLQKQNETLKQEKEKVEAEKEDLQKNYDRLKIENESLVKGKEDLQKNYETLKQEKEKVEAEKEDLQKENGSLKSEKEILRRDCGELQQERNSLKIENESLVKEKEDLQKQNEIYKEEVEADFKELRRKTNTCGYVLEREWKPITEARVNVTLDPDIATPSLTVSEDGSRVRFTGDRSAEWPSVLGREGFTSGKHYWEVEVGEKGYWVLGVSTHTHEKSIPEKPGEGYWFVRLVKGKTCTAVSQSGDQILNLEKICKVWGVYLDHEGGRLSFYNVETRSHIHTLEGSFPGQVYPIFSPGSHDKGPLIIQRVQHTAVNVI